MMNNTVRLRLRFSLQTVFYWCPSMCYEIVSVCWWTDRIVIKWAASRRELKVCHYYVFTKHWCDETGVLLTGSTFSQTRDLLLVLKCFEKTGRRPKVRAGTPLPPNSSSQELLLAWGCFVNTAPVLQKNEGWALRLFVQVLFLPLTTTLWNL